eukprot:COSAG02_NODE_7371_length_3044_cov_2.009508_2_plen_316_part_00
MAHLGRVLEGQDAQRGQQSSPVYSNDTNGPAQKRLEVTHREGTSRQKQELCRMPSSRTLVNETAPLSPTLSAPRRDAARGIFPPSGDFSWVNPDYKARLEVYLEGTLKPWYTSDYKKHVLRTHMNAVMDLLYADGRANQYVPVRAFDGIDCTEFANREALKELCIPHLAKCAAAMLLPEQQATNFVASFDDFLDAFLERQRECLRELHDGGRNEGNKLKLARTVPGTASTAEDVDFTGSPAHLLFGAFVGDALNLHPCYGAMMSPTGGIVGADNSFWLLRKVGAAGPVLFRHAVAHDAFGCVSPMHSAVASVLKH